MAGIGKTNLTGDLLYFTSWGRKKEFSGFTDPVAGQILICRTAKILSEQPGKILWCHIDHLAKFPNCQRRIIIRFHFAQDRNQILLVKWIGGGLCSSSACKQKKELIAGGRKRKRIQWRCLILQDNIFDDRSNGSSLFAGNQKERMTAGNFTDRTF